jgi:Mg-chelatase subunit ChlD
MVLGNVQQILNHLKVTNLKTFIKRLFFRIGMGKIINYLATGLAAVSLLVGCEDMSQRRINTNSYDLAIVAGDSRPVDDYKRSIAFIFDNSGSMDDWLDSCGMKKLDCAKKSMQDLLVRYDQHQKDYGNLEAALFTFNDNGAEKSVPMRRFNYNLLSKQVANLNAEYDTPLGMTLAAAQRELVLRGHGQRSIIMLTDGANNFGQEPDEIYQKMQVRSGKEKRDTNLYLVAFATDSSNFASLEKMGALVYNPQNGAELSSFLNLATDQIFAEDPSTLDPSIISK